ncbi:hypothetical protein F5888DRAFT_1886948 [Russula emetica]|nr:hypothetical protein F5888DRAFT_1886948 [Russula emetica]
MDNIIVALEHNDRVCQIDLSVTNSQMEEVLAAMQQPFPALTELRISWAYGQKDETRPVVPESFWVDLHHVYNISSCMVFDFRDYPNWFCLPLTLLETLSLESKSPLSRPVRESRRPHPLTRSTFPALTSFWFKGVSEYLEDLVARIDAPLLRSLHIAFFHQLIFDTPQLAQFVARTPIIQPPVEARIDFSGSFVEVISPQTLSGSSSFPEAFIPTVEHLYICEGFGQPRWQDDIEDSQWLELLHPFTAVKYLYLTQKFESRIAPALQELAGEVLPSLQNLFLDDPHPSWPVEGAIGKFAAARQLAGHPIAVSFWNGKYVEW